MTVISIDLNDAAFYDALLAVLVLVAVYAGYKLRRFPKDMSDNIAMGLARFTKQTDKGEALAHLSGVIQDAFDGNYLRLAELLGNPIAMKAWDNVKGIIPQIAGGMNKVESIFAE